MPGWRARRVIEKPDLAVVEFGQDGLGGELGVEDARRRVVPGHLVPVVSERDDSPALAGLGQVGRSRKTRRQVPASFGEKVSTERVRWERRGTSCFPRNQVLAPVHDGVEVQVQRLAVGHPRPR